jgi:hypothetical protein
MKALASLTLAFALLLTAAAPASASVMVSLNNPGSTTLHEIEVTPGSTFNVDVNLDTSRIVRSIWVEAMASASHTFEIIGAAAQSPWLLSGTGAGSLDPVSGDFFWGLAYPDRFGPGTCTLGTLEFAVAPTAQGAYTLDLWPVCYDWLGDWAVGTSGPSFVVHVTPEPGASLLALGACIFFCLRHRR